MRRYSILSVLDTQQLSDDSLGDTPVPMPNTEVKHFNADDSRATAKIGSCHLLSILFNRKRASLAQ